MHDPKLLIIYGKMTGVEKRMCTHFIKSSYFNQRADVVQLWDWILLQKAKTWDEQAAFSAIYPGAPFREAQWRYAQTFLVSVLEAFLAQRAQEQLPIMSDLHLAAVYRQKNLQKPLEYTLRRAADQLEKLPRDKDFYHYSYLLEWEKYVTVESQNRTGQTNLAAVNQALDIYLISSKLRLACLMESHRAVYQVDYDSGYMPLILDWLQGSPLKNTPVVALYYHCYMALHTGNEQDFRAFRAELEIHPELPADERRTFLLLAVNFCIKRLNTGEKHYIREAFGLYKVGLETGVLIENGFLSRFAYKNIVALAILLEEYTWTHQFIGRYDAFLEEKYRSANRDYNLARLYFAQKDYARAMPLLAQVDEADLLLNLDSRVMLLKMYYETDELDALDALIASFRVLLLRKKKVIGYHQQYYLNTIRYMRKLARLNLNDKSAIAALRAEIHGNTALLEKDWFPGYSVGMPSDDR